MEMLIFFGSVIQKFQRLKIRTMVVVFEKNPEFSMRVITYDLFHNFKLIIIIVSYVTNQYYIHEKIDILSLYLIKISKILL